MTIDEMLEIKKEYGYSYEYISKLSGVPASTVQKVFSGTTSAPRRLTLEALCRVFESLKSKNISRINYVCEETGEYYTDGSAALKLEDYKGKTIDDYLSLPADIRAELIDGVFYDMASPSPIHQSISLDIAVALHNYIDSNKGACQTFTAPIDVQLDCDDKTIVQPDILVLCDKNKLNKERIVGAPDLVIEILSPSTRYHDTKRKLYKYINAGVREYWIVMPDTLKILVYAFEKSSIPVEYSFTDKVPVNIWNGKCSVDFKKIYARIRI